MRLQVFYWQILKMNFDKNLPKKNKQSLMTLTKQKFYLKGKLNSIGRSKFKLKRKRKNGMKWKMNSMESRKRYWSMKETIKNWLKTAMRKKNREVDYS